MTDQLLTFVRGRTPHGSSIDCKHLEMQRTFQSQMKFCSSIEQNILLGMDGDILDESAALQEKHPVGATVDSLKRERKCRKRAGAFLLIVVFVS